MDIHPTPTEDQIFSLLDDCARYIKDKEGIETSCRVAGGWVRDKLLGSQSNDIDIALTDMMGVPFAERLIAFCSSVKHIETGTIAKVESNPDQSKHLETAKTKLLGLELDFVNLRSEEYAENSRIPTQVTFGTPLQDALRRDITINALFYNVHSRSVEDFTGKGLEDLRNGIIRTPLPPKETFLDDPLRVIRCVRFASRFGFEMVQELRDAIQDPGIQEALVSKISRERVGEEIDKMMKGKNPLHSIQLITELGLFPSIFHVPRAIEASFSEKPTPFITGLVAATLFRKLSDPSPLSNLPSQLGPSLSSIPPVHPILLSAIHTAPSPSSRLYLACALTPYRGITYVDAKQKTHLAVEAIIREGLKLGTQNHYLDGIPALFNASRLIQEGVAQWKSGVSATRPERVFIGTLLRNKTVHDQNTGSIWSISVLFSLIRELLNHWNLSNNTFDNESAAETVQKYNDFVSRVEGLDLPAAVDAKPILDGREVVQTLGASKPGAWTGQVLSRVIEWQLEHPKGTRDECEAWLKAEQAAGTITINVDTSVGKRSQHEGRGLNTKKAKR